MWLGEFKHTVPPLPRPLSEEKMNRAQRVFRTQVVANQEIFRLIIKNTEGLVAQIDFQMVPQSEDRKDLAQDIYLKTFKNLERASV